MTRYKHIKNRRERRQARHLGSSATHQSPVRMQDQSGSHYSFEALAEEIVAQNVPPGWENDPWVIQRVEALVDHAYQGWMAGYEAGGVDEDALVHAQQQGYQAAMAEVERSTAEAYQRGYKQALRAMDGAESAAYQRGYKEGLRAGQQSAKVTEKERQNLINEGRSAAIDECLEQCRVIEESNPNMAAGVKATARMIKKLKGK